MWNNYSKQNLYVTLMKTTIQKMPWIEENEPAIGRNEAVLNSIPSEVYIIEADNKIPNICKYPIAMILAAQNQNQINTGGLAKLLKLKIGAKVMLTVNVDIQYRLINGQHGKC